MMPAIINTITMVLLALLFSVPFGIGAAIYLVEYAKKGNKLVELVRITAETLTGIPSIIYGLFGMLFFVTDVLFYNDPYSDFYLNVFSDLLCCSFQFPCDQGR